MAVCGVMPAAATVPVFPVGTNQHYRGATALAYSGTKTDGFKSTRVGTRVLPRVHSVSTPF